MSQTETTEQDKLIPLEMRACFDTFTLTPYQQRLFDELTASHNKQVVSVARQSGRLRWRALTKLLGHDGTRVSKN